MTDSDHDPSPNSVVAARAMLDQYRAELHDTLDGLCNEVGKAARLFADGSIDRRPLESYTRALIVNALLLAQNHLVERDLARLYEHANDPETDDR